MKHNCGEKEIPIAEKHLQNKSMWLFLLSSGFSRKPNIGSKTHETREIYFHDKATETWLWFISSESKQTNEDVKYQSINVSSRTAEEAFLLDAA